MIELSYSVTEAEYLEAQSLYVRRKQRRSLLIFRIAIIVGACVVLVSPLLKTLREGVPFEFVTYIPAFVVAALFLLAVPWIQRRAFRRRYKVEAPNLTGIHMKLDDAGMSVSVPGIGSGFVEWGGLSEWIEGKLVFMLIAGYTFRLIPKTALTVEQSEEIRSLLARHMTPAKP